MKEEILRNSFRECLKLLLNEKKALVKEVSNKYHKVTHFISSAEVLLEEQ